MTNWINSRGVYTVLLVAEVDKQQINADMDALEERLQIAEAAIVARRGMASFEKSMICVEIPCS
ncbi:pilus assembly protein PilO [Sporosarcina aquimarina]|uniref:pilus assembly protein PilO n=1 Tax=Sporosarcina aquimarina TaxID=114975 RepID=UPI001C8DD53A|nr:pilus assembly protein PilO [Sporosarcina aquimarina]MBY0223914.1 pilus assembly protein PilO [Sporosarcina aquimarina]